MVASGLVNTFLAAIQASLSVLLVMTYGAVSARFGLVDAATSKKISKICVQVFLPALLFVQIGSELHVENVRRYGIIFLWAIICHLVSFIIGITLHLGFGFPDWLTASLMFNNSTSYPLLLIDALYQTGILGELVVGRESTKDAIERAKSYFLVFATVSSCLTFAVGPRLIDSEHAPETIKDVTIVADPSVQRHPEEANETTGLLGENLDNFKFGATTSFFPSNRRPSAVPPPSANRRASIVPRTRWQRLSPRTQWWLLFISDFFNSSLIGAVAGALVGLIPPLQRAFFSKTADGGVFTAWFTASLKSIGSLFVPLPVLIAGVSLYLSTKKAQSSERAAKLPLGTTIIIIFVRFVFWPIVSISAIYALAAKTDVLGRDPMLWFAMMLMPTGPSAIKLINMIQISDAGEEEEHMIAKLLTVSYIVSPILSFTVVASLKASEAGVR